MGLAYLDIPVTYPPATQNVVLDIHRTRFSGICEILSPFINTARLPLVGVTGIRLDMSPYATGQKVIERLNVLNH